MASPRGGPRAGAGDRPRPLARAGAPTRGTRGPQRSRRRTPGPARGPTSTRVRAGPGARAPPGPRARCGAAEAPRRRGPGIGRRPARPSDWNGGPRARRGPASRPRGAGHPMSARGRGGHRRPGAAAPAGAPASAGGPCVGGAAARGSTPGPARRRRPRGSGRCDMGYAP